MNMNNTMSLRRTTRKMNLRENLDQEFLPANFKVAAVEKDSGVYDPLSVNYSKSNCSGLQSSPSPNTTSSSAYASVTPSCCDSSRVRPENSRFSINTTSCSRIPHHPIVTNALPSESSCFGHLRTASNLAAPTTYSHPHLRSRGSSSKSESSPSEDTRFLYNVSNCKIYEKIRLLGKGGFAKVYEVVEVNEDGKVLSDESYAAKIISKSRISRPQQREKVDIEIELMTEARGHPNTVNLLDSFEDENCVCILLEFCRKKSLAQYLRRKQYLGEPEVCHIMQQIVSGLAHLHNKGIIHRDLKLGNILLTENMQAKIGDFGLASRVEWGKKKTICGTPNFIAPEVLQRQGHGPESDVWALGCLLYTMLVGKPPFETACLRDTYRCIVKNAYRVPSTVSAEAADLIRSMLRPKPKTRPTLEEIASHAFFKKHAPYLQSVQKARISSSNSYLPACSRKNSDVFAADHLTQEKSVKAELNQTESTSDSSRKSVKKLASRLYKKLNKASQPMRAVAASFRESKKSSSTKHSKENNNDLGLSSTRRTNTVPKTWVNKWVDYSNRYGFGYQLSNGKICVLFNDGKHISLYPNGNIMEYVASETAETTCFSSDAVPFSLMKYANILHTFTHYMDKNLRPSQDLSAEQQNKESVRLVSWCRTAEYVAMSFNDGTLQVNFTSDHVKVNISSLHNLSAMRLTFVSSKREYEGFTASEFTSQASAEMKEKVNIIHDQLHTLFTDAGCSSHPLCQLR